MDEQQNINQGRDQFIHNYFPQKQELSDAPPGEPKYPYWLSRFTAFMFDFLMSSTIPLIVGLLYYESLPVGFWGGRQDPTAVYFLLFVCSIAYYPCFEASPWQGTIGKLIVGLIVTDIQGERISFSRSLTRLIIKVLLLFLLCIVGFMLYLCAPLFFVILLLLPIVNRILVRPGQLPGQPLHDFITGCLVVEKRT